MPPGASLLMKGLGMREMDRRIKDGEKGRNYSGKYDRPKYFFHNGVNYRVPPELHSNKPCTDIPFDEYGMVPSPVLRKYLDDPERSSHGLDEDPLRRQFEYERSLWPSLGFISPYKNDPGRARRDDLEYELWLQRHKGRVEERRDEDFDEDFDWPPYDRPVNYAQPRGRLPGKTEYAHRRNPQTPYGTRRPARSYNRPPHRPRGSVDPRDPIYRPPVPPTAMNPIPSVTNSLPSSLYQNVGSRHPDQHPTDTRLPGPRPHRTSHPAYGIRRYGEPPGRRGPHVVENRGHRVRGGNPFIDDDHEFQDEGRPEFIAPVSGIHRQPRMHPHHHFNEIDDDDVEDEDTHSYHRLHPRILYPPISPYHGRPLDHRHEFELDDEEDVDELFRPRGEYAHRRRNPYGIGIGREGRRLRVGRRGYEREDLDYGFSGDEDDFVYHV